MLQKSIIDEVRKLSNQRQNGLESKQTNSEVALSMSTNWFFFKLLTYTSLEDFQFTLLQSNIIFSSFFLKKMLQNEQNLEKRHSCIGTKYFGTVFITLTEKQKEYKDIRSNKFKEQYNRSIGLIGVIWMIQRCFMNICINADNFLNQFLSMKIYMRFKNEATKSLMLKKGR